jgi:hypothetical protein
MTQLGEKVYIPHLQEFGIVDEVRADGRITKVKIGDRIIDVLEYVVKNYSSIKYIIVSLLKLFR